MSKIAGIVAESVYIKKKSLFYITIVIKIIFVSQLSAK